MARRNEGNRMSAILSADESPQTSTLWVIWGLDQTGFPGDSPGLSLSAQAPASEVKLVPFAISINLWEPIEKETIERNIRRHSSSVNKKTLLSVNKLVETFRHDLTHTLIVKS